jgi:mRNA interferase YafQ
MFSPVYTKQFQKDVKRCKRRGKNLDKFKLIANDLLSGETLDPLQRDHLLIGNYAGRRKCHIESDWLLIYQVEQQRIIFERLGTHSDLFKR